MTRTNRARAGEPRVRAAASAVLAALALAVLACGEADEPEAEALRHVSQPEALALLEADAPPLFLDVRTPEEFAGGRVAGALLVPHTELPDRLDEVLAQRERLVVVYCESGRRAAQALDLLQEAGLEHLAVLDGHMKAWREAGLPLER
ncbi:MAG: rhodanese-like domain-containing protein [Myxococcota bacterium]